MGNWNQEVIIDSTGLGVFSRGDGDFAVYAEVCKLNNLTKPVYVARIVECPDGRADDEVRRVEFGSESTARNALESLVLNYKRNFGLAF